MKKTYQQLKKSLEQGDVLHTTRNDIDFKFVGWEDDGSLTFSIPSRDRNKPDNIKRIPKDVLTGKVRPTFTDCRLSVYKKL